MKRLVFSVALVVAFAGLVADPTAGQPTGGGRRPPQPPGRPATPSFQRPSPRAAAPQFRPQNSFARPGIVPSRPSVTRPNFSPQRTVPGMTRPNFTRPSPVQRPQFTRPNVIVPQRPTAPVRPNFATRPGFLRPQVAERPWVNRPNVVNRPNFSTRDWVNRNRVNSGNINRWNQWQNRGAYQRPWWDRPAYWNRSWYAGRPVWYWSRPYYWQHSGWHHGYWNYWNTLPALWFGTGLASGWLLSPGDSFAYYNPYYIPPVGVTNFVTQYLDYSNPLPLPTATESAYAYPPEPGVLDDGTADFAATAPPTPQVDDAAVRASGELLDQARGAFRDGDYVQAQSLVERAIAQLPSDPALHEFRALTLFAQQKYRETASALYAVLAAGPGWDWATMASFYHDVDTYTRQLRVLEDFVRRSPDDAAARFVLSYHYLVLGHKDLAVAQLRAVVRLQPQDKLSAALLQALTSAAGGVAGPPPANG